MQHTVEAVLNLGGRSMNRLWRLVWIFGFSGAGFAIGFLGLHSRGQFNRGEYEVSDFEICVRNGFIGLLAALVILIGIDFLNQSRSED